MRSIALIAGLAILILAAGCTAPPGAPNGTPAPSAAVTTAQPAGPAVSLSAGAARIDAAGAEATVPIVLSAAPNGLSGYNVTVALADPAVAEIAAVAYPDWAALKATPAVPAGRVTLQAVDMSMQVPVGATNVTIATLTVRGLKAGSTAVTVTPDRDLGVQDRRGDLYAVTPVAGAVTVGG